MAEVPDYCSPLTGWRRFHVRDRQRVLVSVVYPIPWLTADPGEAVCLWEDWHGMPWNQHEHPVQEPCPSFGCACGFYAYRTRKQAQAHPQGVVLGRVALWGRVVMHERGYRASRIRLMELVVPIGYPAVSELAARYQVPVVQEGGRWISDKPSESSWSSRSASLNTNTGMSPILTAKPSVSPSLQTVRQMLQANNAVQAALEKATTRVKVARKKYGAAVLRAHQAEIVAAMVADPMLTLNKAIERILDARGKQAN